MKSEADKALLQEMLDSSIKADSGAIDLTQADRIAEGGTHVLYRFPNASFVIKVMKQNPSQEELDELERKYAILYNCFDRDDKQRCIREIHGTYDILLPDKEPYRAALSFAPYENAQDPKQNDVHLLNIDEPQRGNIDEEAPSDASSNIDSSEIGPNAPGHG